MIIIWPGPVKYISGEGKCPFYISGRFCGGFDGLWGELEVSLGDLLSQITSLGGNASFLLLSHHP